MKATRGRFVDDGHRPFFTTVLSGRPFHADKIQLGQGAGDLKQSLTNIYILF